jgi:hypothetical protein
MYQGESCVSICRFFSLEFYCHRMSVSWLGYEYNAGGFGGGNSNWFNPSGGLGGGSGGFDMLGGGAGGAQGGFLDSGNKSGEKKVHIMLHNY